VIPIAGKKSGGVTPAHLHAVFKIAAARHRKARNAINIQTSPTVPTLVRVKVRYAARSKKCGLRSAGPLQEAGKIFKYNTDFSKACGASNGAFRQKRIGLLSGNEQPSYNAQATLPDPFREQTTRGRISTLSASAFPGRP
jgi:hypothetical protein